MSGHKIPGYQGYISGMKNHVIGKRYSEATRRADECTSVLRGGGNPSSLETLVDSRPQGRDFLYAQVAHSGPQEEPVLAPAHVGKRRPLVNEALGETDFRLMKTSVGSAGVGTMMAKKSASLPALPYSAKKFFTGQELKAGADMETNGNLPGYTGHQHAAQHVYAKSYGSTTKTLQESDEVDMTDRSQKFLYYGEWRPVGDVLTEKHRIPGYQGYIPGKDNHIYGKTYGQSTNLAPLAEKTMKSHGNASSLEELVDTRPQGGAQLYAQSSEGVPYDRIPLPVHVSKGVVKMQYLEKGVDNKMREKVPEDIKTVKQAKHRVVGYTGHVHGQQHVYAQSFGKMTRSLHGGEANLKEPNTSDDLLYYKDNRPQYT